MVDKFEARNGATIVVTYDESENSVFYPSETIISEIIYIKKNGDSKVILGGKK